MGKTRPLTRSLSRPELSRQAGDVLGLALELSLDEARFEVVQSALTPLLREPGPDAIQRRSLVAEDLVRLNVTVGKSLARELTRQILADAGALGDRALANTAGATAHWVGGAFDADLPTVASFQRLRTDQTVRHRYSAHECGTRALHDVHPCGSRFLVALGEGPGIATQSARSHSARSNAFVTNCLVGRYGSVPASS